MKGRKEGEEEERSRDVMCCDVVAERQTECLRRGVEPSVIARIRVL